ncbi:MAG: hypothetical protein OXD49_14145 [Candidatus Poribacteria bacterium]|nr:hypothetical protein [Candidatus Poribacteria bacterium]
MKTAKICLFFIIGGVVFTGVLWFFLRGTTSQETRTVYKTVMGSNRSGGQQPTGISSDTHSHTHASGKLHSHSDDTPHTHESPSNEMIRILKENLGGNQDPIALRWIAYLESEEGRAFMDGMPTADEWFEKSKSFGLYQDTPERRASTEQWYRQHFPTGTVDENTSIIRDIMRDAILENELYKEGNRSQNANVLHQIAENDKFLAWYDKKFGLAPPSARRWIFETFEEIRLAERAKYLGTENTEMTTRINDSTGSKRSEAEIELPPGDGQTPANTRPLSEDILTVEDILSDDANTQQAEIETLTPTVPEAPELPNRKNLETKLRTQFLPDRFNRAMKTLNQYGPQEGLRRLKSSDPEVAKQVERLLPKPQGEE